jgi:hypothetical protein
MRRILLALIVFACVTPAAEAAQRENQRSSQAPGRTAQQAKPPQVQARTQAQRPTAQRPTAQQARAQQTRRQPASNLRPGDVRTSSSGLLVRGASAATISRESPMARTQTSRRNAVANCTGRNGRNACAPARSSVAGWQSGLPTANYAQRECPVGTFATLARGHDDVVRCMPF